MARRWVTSRGTDGVQRLNQTRASIVSRSAGKPLAHRAANVQRTTYACKANPAGFLAETFGGPSEELHLVERLPTRLDQRYCRPC